MMSKVHKFHISVSNWKGFRVSKLALVKKGPIVSSNISVIYGASGVGKSTFAAEFPSPLFIDIENGSRHLNVTRLTSEELPKYSDLVETIKELAQGKHDFKTLVIDSLTVLEKYLEKHICGTKYKDISDIPYGGGYAQLVDEGVSFMNLLRDVQKSGMEVLLIGHTREKNFTDAYDNSSYHRYVLQINDKLAEKIIALSDNVFFARNDVTVISGEKGTKAKAIGTGDRKLFTEWRPGADAKNRYSLPYELPLSYKSLKEAMDKFAENAKLISSGSPCSIKAEIKILISKAEPVLVEKASTALADAGDDMQKLINIKTRLMQVVG